MSVRVVARIRPLLKQEIEKDRIVQTDANVVRIPNPKNAAENISFNFNSVYDQDASQQDLFEHEVSPTVKHLFNGYDITLFAYGVTGTGKTHTMRGGKSLADRGVIPRLLSAIYRRGRKIEKDTAGEKRVDVYISYYEIYNDKVYDLFEPPEKRSLSGLPIRDCNGKTVIAGLTERPCSTLKEFEQLYDHANINRSTAATKLNAHSSRSHAILGVKICQVSGDSTLTSTASAIDLAGSEDNRRTENGKERLVESSAINKSLFVLAQCVEAIGKKQARIPYRESKMTRILSLGQNNGLTIMILNLAPVRAFHLDTLSSLSVANRTRKIEIREVENEPIFKLPTKQSLAVAAGNAAVNRQPLRTIPGAINDGLTNSSLTTTTKPKPAKSFSVYAERNRLSSENRASLTGTKRTSDATSTAGHPAQRPIKAMRTTTTTTSSVRPKQPELSRADVESLVNRLVSEKLAEHAALSEATAMSIPSLPAPQAVSDEVTRRLAALEERIGQQEDARAEGLQYLLSAKQHQSRGEDLEALSMYRKALPFFPDNEKLASKMLALQQKLNAISRAKDRSASPARIVSAPVQPSRKALQLIDDDDDNYVDADYQDESDGDFKPRKKTSTASRKQRMALALAPIGDGRITTPRTRHLLDVINTRDLTQIRELKGVGAKKAEAIVNALCMLDDDDGVEKEVKGLTELGSLKGIGLKSVLTMRGGIEL